MEKLTFPTKRKRGNIKGMNRRDATVGFLMALVPFLGFVFFSLFPMLLSLVVSFFELHSYDFTTMEYVGLENYIFVFTNKWVGRSVINTLRYCLSVPINIVMSLFLANLFMKPLKGARVGAVIAYLPTVCPVLGITLAFQWIFDYNGGVFNTIISALGGEKIDFLGSTRYFMPSVLLISVWMKGTNILQLQTAMANVDQSLKEAAQIDGANGTQIFFKVVMPAISPTLFYVLVMWLVASLQDMAVMSLVSSNTGGEGPDFQAVTISYYLYRMVSAKAITIDGFGRASALGWVFAAVVVIISRILFKLSDKFVTYD